jgi:hypothetical protein
MRGQTPHSSLLHSATPSMGSDPRSNAPLSGDARCVFGLLARGWVKVEWRIHRARVTTTRSVTIPRNVVDAIGLKSRRRIVPHAAPLNAP